MSNLPTSFASDEHSVGPLYQSRSVAEEYIDKRFTLSWQRLLHKTQVARVERVLSECKPQEVLEIAPGPARIAADLQGLKRGTMVEYSQEMIEVARRRIEERTLTGVWRIVHGNAFELASLPGTFDFVYTFRFIRHFHECDRARLYAAISAKLQARGLLMFDVVNRPLRQKLDVRSGLPIQGALPVYDVTYTADEFRAEMERYGFEVLSMAPVLRHFETQAWISSKLDDVVPRLSESLVRRLEKVPTRNPLEWVTLCRKT